METDERFRALGEELKRARIARHRSLDDIALQTKLSRRHLEAIELGDLTRLPQGPYVKAFVREFARAVGVDVPTEFAHFMGAPSRSPKDPKVVSHTAGERPAQISGVARGTARMANMAMRTAVKSVTKTTENVVQMVESGGKEAFEALTSKNLWDEAENVRRERHGLPPLPVEQKPEDVSLNEPSPPPDETAIRSPRIISKRSTNVVIALLALLFAGVMFFALRMYRSEGANVPGAKGDYVPAPVESPTPVPSAKRGSTASTAAPAPHGSPVKDTLHFTLHALQPVWVAVAPDGIAAYRGQLRAGETRSFRAAEKILLDIGNQKFVEMQLDGQRLSNLPTIQNSNVVIRNLVLMRNRVSMGGQELDWKKLTSTPRPAAVVALPPSAPASSKKLANTTTVAKPVAKTAAKTVSKATAKSSPVNKTPPNTKLAAPKTKSAKTKKPRTSRAVEFRSVEPIPPGP